MDSSDNQTETVANNNSKKQKKVAKEKQSTARIVSTTSLCGLALDYCPI